MADCSKTEVFLAELERMCCSCDAKCNGCGFEDAGDCGQISVLCECGQSVVQKWSDEHPAPKPKTYADDFFLKFPNAPKRDDGTPVSLWCNIYSNGISSCSKDKSICRACWKEPYKEET